MEKLIDRLLHPEKGISLKKVKKKSSFLKQTESCFEKSDFLTFLMSSYFTCNQAHEMWRHMINKRILYNIPETKYYKIQVCVKEKRLTFLEKNFGTLLFTHI